MDEPDDGDEEGIEEEHHGLLLDDAEGLAVDIVEAEAFHDECHERSGEEQPHGVLQSEREFVLAASAVHFDVGDVVEEGGDDELVEEGDGHHGEDGHQRGCSLAHRLNCMCLGVDDEVEDGCDHSQQQAGQYPSHC